MTALQPSRRRFVGGVAVSSLLATAGCLGSLDDVGADDAGGPTLALTLSRVGGTLRETFVTDLADTTPEWDEAGFEAVLDGETYTAQYRKPFFSTPEDPGYTERDGTYYRLGAVVVDEVEVTRPVLRLAAAGESADGVEAVPADRLPEVDTKAVHVAQMAARARGNEGGAPWGLVQRGGYVYRGDRAAESELAADDGPDVVRFRDRRYAVDVTRERFYEPVYRATVEPVADSPERMEAILRAKFVDARFDRDGLSAGARDVVEAAREGRYEETHPYSSAYREVLRAMHERAYLDGNVRKDAGVDDGGRTLLRYDGVYYDYRLAFRGADA